VKPVPSCDAVSLLSEIEEAAGYIQEEFADGRCTYTARYAATIKTNARALLDGFYVPSDASGISTEAQQ